MSGIISDNFDKDSGLIKSGVSSYDDNKIQTNIALIGFKTAINEDLVKYNLVDQTIDEYEDASGVDAGASTNEVLTSSYYHGNESNLTLQSNDTTAEAVPTYADMVCLIEDGAGTATLNTDIKGFVSRDSGSNFTEGSFTNEGSWGTNKKIITFHDLDISGQPSGTSVCYKITTHNQSGSKITRIHATSIGWK